MRVTLQHLTAPKPFLFAVIVVLGVQIALALSARIAFAFTESNHISFSLEGCRNNGTITLPNGSGQFICPDAAYTSGNLGKGWNELDLVPHRLTTQAGNQSGTTTDYDVYIAADYQSAGRTGYDVISAPTLNTAKSDSSCSVTAGAQSTTSGALLLSTDIRGVDSVISRQLTIHQAAGTTCVFDYYERLALGSHLYPGSSLQSYMYQGVGLTGGKQTISIPVNDVLPQSLSKNMTATQGTGHAWDITKSAPADLTFGNTCVPDQLAQQVQISVTWTKLAANPGGAITIITHVLATNPSARTITTVASDQIFTGTTVLDTSPQASVDVPANSLNYPILTHTFQAPTGTTNLNDKATATYIDTVTGVAIPGMTTAVASAPVQITGPDSDASATINDVENISGADLQFSADSFAPEIGTFDNGYVSGTHTDGPVSWTSVLQGDSGKVTFSKTVHVNGPSQTTGTLTDTATLTGSNGFTNATPPASVSVSADARVTLTINKSIPATADLTTAPTFTFHVKNNSGQEVASPSLMFNAGDTSKSAFLDDLAPDTYTVTEDVPTGWGMDGPHAADIRLPACSGVVNFANVQLPTPTMITTPDPASGLVGETLHDSATLSGDGLTGDVTFNLYGPNDTTCSDKPVHTERVALDSNSASTLLGFVSTSVGTYRWTATYSGDPSNSGMSSGCDEEQVIVDKGTSGLSTLATAGPVENGQPIRDVATLTGAANLSGTITFTVFGPGDTNCSSSGTNVSTADVSGPGPYTSSDYTPTAPGTYRWIAHYSGDTNNAEATTLCNDDGESSTVTQATSSLSTSASPTSGTVGEPLMVGDSATITGGLNPGGAIVFTLYSDAACTSPAAVSGSDTIANGSASFSTSWTPSAPGTYTWIADYEGDANNAPVSSRCGDNDEQIVILEATATPTPSPLPTTTVTATPTGTPTTCLTPTPLPVTFTPTATLQPTFTATATATVTLTATPPPTATNTPVPGATATPTNPPGAPARATATPTSTATSTRTATPTGTPPPTATSTPSPPTPGGAVVSAPPTATPMPLEEVAVLDAAVTQVEARRAREPRTTPPPVQLPPVADGIYNFLATTFVAQSTPPDSGGCETALDMSSGASPSTAVVGDEVDFTYTVTNIGTVALTDVQVVSALPDGLTFVSATNGGSMQADTGYIGWALEGGLDAGASTSMSVSAMIADDGQHENHACSAGTDVIGTLAEDCASVVVAAVTMTPTPTATTTATPTATTTTTPTATGTVTPQPSPTATQTATPVPTDTPPPTPTPEATATPTPETAPPEQPTPTPVPPDVQPLPIPMPQPLPEPAPPEPAPEPAPIQPDTQPAPAPETQPATSAPA